MAMHKLKCWPHEFHAVQTGAKKFEVRKNTDRSFDVGDHLLLYKWDPAAKAFAHSLPGAYVTWGGWASHEVGASIAVKVTYILHGGRFDLPSGLCVMGIERCCECETDLPDPGPHIESCPFSDPDYDDDGQA